MVSFYSSFAALYPYPPTPFPCNTLLYLLLVIAIANPLHEPRRQHPLKARIPFSYSPFLPSLTLTSFSYSSTSLFNTFPSSTRPSSITLSASHNSFPCTSSLCPSTSLPYCPSLPFLTLTLTPFFSVAVTHLKLLSPSLPLVTLETTQHIPYDSNPLFLTLLSFLPLSSPVDPSFLPSL